MNIAFYLDHGAPERLPNLQRAIAAVLEHMPHAAVIHLTTEQGPRVPGVSKVVYVEGSFGFRRGTASATVQGDTLFLDCDCIVQADVSGVFKLPFDVAVARHREPPHPSLPCNGGVVFSRCPQFYRDFAQIARRMEFDPAARAGKPGNWVPIESAFNQMLVSGNYRVHYLDGDRYNYIPSSQDEDLSTRLIVHYKGSRKGWL